jgi:hypothetical protein
LTNDFSSSTQLGNSATAEDKAARFITNKKPSLVHSPAAPLTKSKDAHSAFSLRATILAE